MHTIKISISEVDYQKFGLKKEKLSFSELLDIIERELARENLSKAVSLVKNTGFHIKRWKK